MRSCAPSTTPRERSARSAASERRPASSRRPCSQRSGSRRGGPRSSNQRTGPSSSEIFQAARSRSSLATGGFPRSSVPVRSPLRHSAATLRSRNLQAVQGQLTQLERLMADLLSAEQRTPGDDAPVDAAAEARQAIARARIRGARIDLDAPAQPVRVAIGRARFAQILDNLISNAIKYSPTAEPILVSIQTDATSGKVSVVDQGMGIPTEHLARVFDRFYRVGGTADAVAGQGLGLSICKEIVTAHGGKIWAESEGPGRGSTFSFTLPLAIGAATT